MGGRRAFGWHVNIHIYKYVYVCIQELLMWIKGVGLVGLLDDGGTCTTLKRNKSAYHL